jgi:hypothetical protein
MNRPLRMIVPALGLATLTLLSAPASAQEGLLMRQMLGNLGIMPDERDPIDYKERPGLVVPKELGKLPAPEAAGAKNDPRWPKDPDVAERAARRHQRENPGYISPSVDPTNGARLSPAELAKARTNRDTSNWNGYNYSDKGGVRLSVQEMAAGKTADEPTYPPGTEPPRKYLTDPPVGTRLPSAAAPMGRGRAEARNLDYGRPTDAWKARE